MKKLGFVIVLTMVILSKLLSYDSNADELKIEQESDTYSKETILNGFDVSKDFCSSKENTLWVDDGSKNYCIKFYPFGLSDQNDTVAIFFHGDLLGRDWDNKGNTIKHIVLSYHDNDIKQINSYVKDMYGITKLPYIYYARLGTLGSSGDHKKRHTLSEVKTTQEALNKIKEKYYIRKFILIGQSGGGLLVASLLTQRDDIIFAAISSGLLSVKDRIRIMKWPKHSTGFDFYDPIDHVNEISPNKDLKIFIIGDPKDKNVPFKSQEAYYKALKEHGLNAFLIKAGGRGKSHHGLSREAEQISSWWVNGVPIEDILSAFKKKTDSEILKYDLFGEPNVFCEVIQEPNPLLIGGWKCRGGKWKNPVEYWLVKKNNQYAIYYYYSEYSGEHQYLGWRPFKINGDEISSKNGIIKFFTKKNEVYFQYGEFKPWKMTQIKNK